MPQRVTVEPDGEDPYTVELPWDGPFRFAQPIKRHNKTSRDMIKPYRSHRVYIVDEPDEDAEDSAPTRDGRAQVHADKCRCIRAAFTNNFGPNCYVKGVRFSPQRDVHQLKDYFETELQKFTPEDLIIIYYHGQAGVMGQKNIWHTASGKNKDQEATELLKLMNTSDSYCLFLLDSFMPTRYPLKIGRAKGITEFIQNGKDKQRPDEVLVHGGANFTENLAATLDDRQKEIDNGYAGWVEPMTFPELMGERRKLCSNPLRKFTTKTKRFSEKEVRRLAVDPIIARADGYLSLVSVQIQGPNDATHTNGRTADHDDEDDDDFLGVLGPGGGGDIRADSFLEDGDTHEDDDLFAPRSRSSDSQRSGEGADAADDSQRLPTGRNFLLHPSGDTGEDGGLSIKEEFPGLFLPDTAFDRLSVKRSRSPAPDTALARFGRKRRRTTVGGMQRPVSPDDLFVTEQEGGDPAGGLSACQKTAIRAAEASKSLSGEEDEGFAEDDGLDYLDRLTFGGRADVPSRGEELLMSGALGEDDGDDELFMI